MAKGRRRGERPASRSAIASAAQLLGTAEWLRSAGDLARAVELYREAIHREPASPAGYHALGEIFAGLGDLPTALTFFHAALERHPAAPEIHHNIGAIHLQRNSLAMAAEHFRQATALSPRTAAYRNHLGSVLLAQGQADEAETAMRQALALAPGNAEVHANLGYLLSQRLGWNAAEESYRRAVELQPELAQAHVNLSHLLLRRGAFAEGWREAEWRWRWKQFPSPRRGFTQPQWRGEPIAGRTLLLHAEQGFGDALQMLRYVPLVAERGARVVLEVHPELRTLAASLSGVTTLLSRGDSLPEFDLHCPLMSLPLAFGTTLETIPATVPYLTASAPPPSWIQPADHLKVGLVWAGSPANIADRSRSVPADVLAPLLSHPGVDVYSLQLGAATEPGFRGMLPPTASWAETAAAITTLDLVITVDTAVAHLAGALGKPVWILLPALPDWRWLLGREDSPWYPSARLFRQPHPGDWAGVLHDVSAALHQLVQARELSEKGDGSP